MFLVRRAKVEDLPSLLKLAKMVHFINLPPDHEIISEKVSWSRNCFVMAAEEEVGAAPRKPGPAKRHDATEHGALAAGIRNIVGQSPLFMFVMEELDSGGVIGTSQIISRFGGPGQPNVSLQLERKELFSQSLQMGVTHTVARLHLDETGPTEIGGLILQPSFRGHRDKLGRFISLVRFHFMGLHRHHFSSRVLAEMMGPITIDGYNPFWEHCTRAFINLTYEQADKFCQQTKEFILTLFPRSDLYLTLISPEARSVVGTVGPETVPARRMLEKIGFKYHHRVDPFDGGPHLEAQLADIALVNATTRLRFGPAADAGHTHFGIISTLDEDGEFRCVQTSYAVDRQSRLVVAPKILEALAGVSGTEAGLTPLHALAAATTAPAANGAAAKRPAARKKSARR